jgi:serine/threonine protein kinase
MQQGFDLYADIWSLGCTVFEMLTGYPPFYENNDSQWTIMHKIAGTTALPYLPDEKYSEEARDFVYSCMR